MMIDSWLEVVVTVHIYLQDNQSMICSEQNVYQPITWSIMRVKQENEKIHFNLL